MSHDVLMIFVAIMWIAMNFAGASFAWNRLAGRRADAGRTVVLLAATQIFVEKTASGPKQYAYFTEPPGKRSTGWLTFAFTTATLVGLISSAILRKGDLSHPVTSQQEGPKTMPMSPVTGFASPLRLETPDIEKFSQGHPIRTETIRIPGTAYQRKVPLIPGGAPILNPVFNLTARR